jgi:metallo-beta-lactamase family protein
MTTSSSARPEGLAVTFWGAAGEVTGSMHLVEAGGRQVLLDCGLALGSRSDGRPRSPAFPFDPAGVDAVVLSHAHVDHCGNLPRLVRQGFAGPIYCTPATRDLLGIVLVDSARIHEDDAYVDSVLDRTAEAADPSRFTRLDAHRTLHQCVPLPYGQVQEIAPDIQLQLLDAGHILGSAMVALALGQGGRTSTLTFTGDLGRPGMGFLQPPAPVPAADLLLCESTYGGRSHQPVERMLEDLRGVVERTVARGGKVLVPAFSLGRTQLVVYYLQEGMRRGQLPRVPVFVDSPLAADVAEVHRRYPHSLSEGAAALAGPAPGQAASGDPEVRAVRTLEESKELSTRRGACIIVASGGMCEGGRILRHLRENVDDPRCTVVLVSYQAPGSLGRRLLEKGPRVRFLGRTWNKWADVVEFSGFSGHADHDDLLAALKPLAGRTRRVRLVHGEPEQANALARDLRQLDFADVAIPQRGETVRLE